MRPSTVFSLIAGAGAIALALAPAPDEDLRASAVTVAEAQLIEHIRELAQAPAEERLAAVREEWRGVDGEDDGPQDTRPSVAYASLPSGADTTSAAEPPPSPESSNRVVLADALNVRAGPSSQTSVVGRLLRGERVAVLEEQNGWLRISGGESEGWAFSRYLAEAE